MSCTGLEGGGFCNGDLVDFQRAPVALHEDRDPEGFGLAAERADDKAVAVAIVAVLYREIGWGVLAKERIKDDGSLLLRVNVFFVKDADFDGAVEKFRKGAGIALREGGFYRAVLLRRGMKPSRE